MPESSRLLKLKKSDKALVYKIAFHRRMDKDMVYICNRILLSHRQEWNIAICSNMDGPRDNHTKQSKLERKILYNITYTWKLKHSTNIYRTKTDS